MAGRFDNRRQVTNLPYISYFQYLAGPWIIKLCVALPMDGGSGQILPTW